MRIQKQSITIAVCLTAFSILCSASPIAVTGPIQWTSGSGGNDHFYQLFFDNATGGGIAWTAANTYATSIGQHLVTLTSAAEENFVNTTFNPSMPSGSGNAGGTCCPHFWIGLFSPTANGTYQWVTGEALGYTNWIPGEPNNPGSEPYVVDRWQAQSGWNNLPNTAFSPASFFVTETSVPEPGSLILFGTGAVVLAWRRRAHRT